MRRISILALPVLCAALLAPGVASATTGVSHSRLNYDGEALALRSPAPGPAVSATRRPGGSGVVYAGDSAQGFPFYIQVSRDRRSVTRISMPWSADCGASGSITGGTRITRRLRLRRGSFSGMYETHETMSDGMTLELHEQVRGRIGASRASGTWSTHVTVRDRSDATIGECDTGTLRWSALQ